MNAYVHDGELFCERCAPDDAQGYPDGGGEADSPSHCAGCGIFLDNPLTGEGVRYVCGALRRYLRTHGERGASDTLATWAEALSWYGGAAHHIARRFLARYERYEGVQELRKRYAYTGGGYGYRWSSPLERLGGGLPSSRETDPEAEVCGECGAPILECVSDETRSNGGTEWVHEASGIDHEAYPFDPADVWQIEITPEGEYRPIGRCQIDGCPCVIFEYEGETYAVTEASAHKPAKDSAQAT